MMFDTLAVAQQIAAGVVVDRDQAEVIAKAIHTTASSTATTLPPTSSGAGLAGVRTENCQPRHPAPRDGRHRYRRPP